MIADTKTDTDKTRILSRANLSMKGGSCLSPKVHTDTNCHLLLTIHSQVYQALLNVSETV